MAKDEKDIEPDCEPGTAHPRHNYALFGHLEAERVLSEALAGPHPHHAWLISGPKGVGKATLAYRAARCLLGAKPSGPRPLDTAPNDPVAAKVAAQSHPDLLVIHRTSDKKDKLRKEIVVDDARELGAFFAMQPAEGGWRVVLVDCVDELNRNAANALLKSLEEPPARAVMLLICHAPGAVLATLRSRCRRLSLGPLDEAEMLRAFPDNPPSPIALRLANGAPGRAIALQASKADELWEEMARAVKRVVQGESMAFAPLASGRAPLMERFDLLILMVQYLARAAAAPGIPGKALDLTSELGDNGIDSLRWAIAWSELGRLRDQAHGLGLNPVHAIARIGIVLDSAFRHEQVSA